MIFVSQKSVLGVIRDEKKQRGFIPWRWQWQSTPVFLPGEFHGQRILAGYSPWSLKELNMTEQLTHTYRHTHNVICKFFLDVLYQLGEVSFYIYFPESFFKINEC